MMLALWDSIVLTLIESMLATSLLDLLSATSLTICRSRGLSRLEAPSAGAAAKISAQHHLGPPGSEEELMLAECFQGRDEVVARILLENIAPGARAQHIVYHLVRFMHGQNQDPNTRVAFQNLAGGLQAVHIGHGDVHHDDVRPETGGGSHGFAARGGFPAHIPVGAGVSYQPGDAPPYPLMIIHQQYSRFLHWSEPRAKLRSTLRRYRSKSVPTGRQAAPRARACL